MNGRARQFAALSLRQTHQWQFSQCRSLSAAGDIQTGDIQTQKAIWETLHARPDAVRAKAKAAKSE
jgi:hypothetical protein